ncbi:MAG: aspartate aminotransferase family protein [Puniceicoccaceae bacterium]
MKTNNHTVSKLHWERALKVIPGGTHTISKRVTNFCGIDHYPAYLIRGKGSYVWDLDGNRYIDYVAALAPIVLGYGIERIDSRIHKQLDKGALLSLPCPEEIELAELLVNTIPCAEKVRLLKTGAEATSAAVRAARLSTGKEHILSCGYSGWHDWWALLKSKDGIPHAVHDLTHEFGFGDLASARALMDKIGNKVAAIIVTPALYGHNPPLGFLEGLRSLADEKGAVLIFDEIITGFRYALGGAQEKYGVIPDLATFAKSMANGMPIAALVGKDSFMEAIADNWISSTYASESLSIVASIETISILKEERVPQQLHHISKLLTEGIQEIAKDKGILAETDDPLPGITFRFKREEKVEAALNDRFLIECAKRGVLIRKDVRGLSLCLMLAHRPNIVSTSLQVFSEALEASLG